MAKEEWFGREKHSLTRKHQEHWKWGGGFGEIIFREPEEIPSFAWLNLESLWICDSSVLFIFFHLKKGMSIVVILCLKHPCVLQSKMPAISYMSRLINGSSSKVLSFCWVDPSCRPARAVVLSPRLLNKGAPGSLTGTSSSWAELRSLRRRLWRTSWLDSERGRAVIHLMN